MLNPPWVSLMSSNQQVRDLVDSMNLTRFILVTRILLALNIILLLPGLSVHHAVVGMNGEIPSFLMKESRRTIVIPENISELRHVNAITEKHDPDFHRQISRKSHDMYDFMLETENRTDYSDLIIDGDEHLMNLTRELGWSGNGTTSNPIIIEGINFTSHTSDIITIKNTRLHVVFRHNLIIGTLPPNYIDNAFLLVNVSHVTIEHNYMVNVTRITIMEQSNDVTFANNTIQGKLETQDAFLSRIYDSKGVTIADNRMMGTVGSIVEAHNVTDFNLSNNELKELSDTGPRVVVSKSNNVNITNNNVLGGLLIDDVQNITISSNSFMSKVEEQEPSDFSGIMKSSNVNVTGNTFSNLQGLILQENNNTVIKRNYFFNSSYRFLNLNWCSNGIIQQNLFYQATIDALYLFDSNNFFISYNAFIDNNKGKKPQALDDGMNNTFAHNFWSDGEKIDENGDGISDVPYHVGGSSNNSDLTPLMYWIDEHVHIMTTPYIIEPPEGAEVNGTVVIRWQEIYDTQNHSIEYELWYARYGSIKWHLIASNLTTTSFTWDTTQLFDLEFIILKVVARDSVGYSKQYRQVKRIIIDNRLLQVSRPPETETGNSTTHNESNLQNDLTTRGALADILNLRVSMSGEIPILALTWVITTALINRRRQIRKNGFLGRCLSSEATNHEKIQVKSFLIK